MSKLVDFHVHSTASDGSCTPAEIAALAASRGFSAIALTDHDNCDGIAEFLSACSRLAVRGVPGVELSIEPGDGFDKFHLLGLGVDPQCPELRAFLGRILEGRNARNARIIANFNRLGLDIRPEPHGEVLARPHFARWLVEHGHAADVRDAFARYLMPDSPPATRCYEHRYRPSRAEAFAVIHAAGGLAVMAHPKYWRSDWRTLGCDFVAAERELAALREQGLDGIEARYLANTPQEDVEFLRIATRLGYLVTAGSDFHGAAKPEIPLGVEVSDGFLSALPPLLGGNFSGVTR